MNTNIYIDNLPVEVIRQIYSYDSTYKEHFDKVLKQMMTHCFIYNCHKCFKPWNNFYCYCKVCKTHLKFCHQISYDEMSTYEDEIEAIIPLGF